MLTINKLHNKIASYVNAMERIIDDKQFKKISAHDYLNTFLENAYSYRKAIFEEKMRYFDIYHTDKIGYIKDNKHFVFFKKYELINSLNTENKEYNNINGYAGKYIKDWIELKNNLKRNDFIKSKDLSEYERILYIANRDWDLMRQYYDELVDGYEGEKSNKLKVGILKVIFGDRFKKIQEFMQKKDKDENLYYLDFNKMKEFVAKYELRR